MPHSLPPIGIDSVSYFNSQLATLRQEEQETLEPIRDSLTEAYEDYDALLGNPKKLRKLVVSETQAAYLQRIYDRLDNRATKPADLRGHLLLTLVCPYCDYGDCRQIDHFLPKMMWPEYSVHTSNLVPCCADCNQLKAQRHEGVYGSRYFHPYFDAHPTERYLFVSAVISGKDIKFIYNLAFSASVPTVIRNKVSYLYSDLDLLYRFGRRAAAKMNTLRVMLLKQHEKNGSQGVRSYLRMLSRFADTPAGANNWETVLLECLSSDEDFCSLKHWRPRVSSTETC